MGESGAVSGESNTVTERYNSIISNFASTMSSNDRGEETFPCSGADRDRKMTVGRRYKYSQLEWYRIGGAGHRKGDNFNAQHRRCASPDKTPQALGMTKHVKTEPGCSITREPCSCCPHDDDSRTSITIGNASTATSTEQFSTVSPVTTVPSTRTVTIVTSRPYAPSSLILQPSLHHSCSVCGEEFSSYDLLSRHISHHVQAASKPAVHCPFCEDTFSDPIAFFDHAATHVDDNPFGTAVSTEKMEAIGKQSLESIRSSSKRDPSLAEVLNHWQPTSGRNPANYDVESQSETTKLQEHHETEKRHAITELRTFHDGNAVIKDASADSGFSSPGAPAANQNAASPSVSYTVTPITPSHSVTKTHFCFTGLAVGAMSSVEPSYTPPSTIEPLNINTAAITPSSSVFDFTVASNSTGSNKTRRTSIQALPSPVTEKCVNGAAVNSKTTHPATPESDVQDIQQSFDNRSPCDFSVANEDRDSDHESPPRRRRRRRSTLSDVSDVQSEDSDIYQIKFVPSRSRRGS